MKAQETKLYDSGNNPVSLQPRFATAVTVSDTTILQPGTLYIGTGGTVKVRTAGGNDITFSNVQDGSILPVLVDKVYDTGTTDADNIVILR